MLDIKNGIFKIDDQLIIKQGYTFEQFKKTKYYIGQNEMRWFYLEEPQTIDNRKYIVSFIFEKGIIYLLGLMNIDKDIPFEEEYERKKVHDTILMEYGINGKQTYNWGEIASVYDPHGNVSRISAYFY